MEPLTILTMFGAAIGGLWLYLKSTFDARLKDKDARIVELMGERDTARAEVKALNDVLAKNTDALTKIAPALEVLVEVQRHQSRSTATVTDPPLTEGR